MSQPGSTATASGSPPWTRSRFCFARTTIDAAIRPVKLPAQSRATWFPYPLEEQPDDVASYARRGYASTIVAPLRSAAAVELGKSPSPGARRSRRASPLVFGTHRRNSASTWRGLDGPVLSAPSQPTPDGRGQCPRAWRAAVWLRFGSARTGAFSSCNGKSTRHLFVMRSGAANPELRRLHAGSIGKVSRSSQLPLACPPEP